MLSPRQNLFTLRDEDSLLGRPGAGLLGGEGVARSGLPGRRHDDVRDMNTVYLINYLILILSTAKMPKKSSLFLFSLQNQRCCSIEV